MLTKEQEQAYLTSLARQNDMNIFMTVPFRFIKDNGSRRPCRRTDLASCHDLMKSYVNFLTKEIMGRHRHERPPKKQLKFLGIPEIKAKAGEAVFPHWHCITWMPRDNYYDICEQSCEYLFNQGEKYCGYRITPHINPLTKLNNAANYSTKWADDVAADSYSIIRGFTIS